MQCRCAPRHFKWNGLYPKKRNWFLMNYTLSTDWVLFLDADEYVSDAFCDEVAAAIGRQPHAAYWLNYTNYFLGRELKHGVPQRKLAMFKVGAGLYERIDEAAWSQLDMEITNIRLLRGASASSSARVSTIAIVAALPNSSTGTAIMRCGRPRKMLLSSQPERNSQLTQRQRFKYGHIESWWYPWFYFVYNYVFKLGLLDGAAGFYYSVYKEHGISSRFLIRLLVGEPREEPAPVDSEVAANFPARNRAFADV